MLLSNLQDPLSLHEEKLELTRGQTFTCRFGHCTPIVDTIGLRWQLRSSHVCGCATSFRFRNDWLLVTIQLAPFPLRFSFRQFQVFIILFIFFIALKKWPLSLCRYRFRGILSFRTGPNTGRIALGIFLRSMSSVVSFVYLFATALHSSWNLGCLPPPVFVLETLHITFYRLDLWWHFYIHIATALLLSHTPSFVGRMI